MIYLIIFCSFDFDSTKIESKEEVKKEKEEKEDNKEIIDLTSSQEIEKEKQVKLLV